MLRLQQAIVLITSNIKVGTSSLMNSLARYTSPLDNLSTVAVASYTNNRNGDDN